MSQLPRPALLSLTADSYKEQADRNEMSDEPKAAILELLKDQLRVMMMMVDSITEV